METIFAIAWAFFVILMFFVSHVSTKRAVRVWLKERDFELVCAKRKLGSPWFASRGSTILYVTAKTEHGYTIDVWLYVDGFRRVTKSKWIG